MAGFNLEKTAVGDSTASLGGSTAALDFETSLGQCGTAGSATSSAARETLCEPSAALQLLGLMSPPLGLAVPPALPPALPPGRRSVSHQRQYRRLRWQYRCWGL